MSAGEVETEENDYFGDPVVEAARLCGRAEGGQVLVAALVRAMAGRRANQTFVPVGDLDLKGLPEPVTTLEMSWDLVPSVSPGSPFPDGWPTSGRASSAVGPSVMNSLRSWTGLRPCTARSCSSVASQASARPP